MRHERRWSTTTAHSSTPSSAWRPRPTSSAFSTRCPSCQDLVSADATRDLWLVLRLDAVLDRSIPTAARTLDTFPAIEARGFSSSAQWPHSATTTFRSSLCAFAPVGPQNHSLPSCNFHVRELEGLLRMSTNVSTATLHASANLLPTVLAPPFRVSKLNLYNFSSCRDALPALLPWLASKLATQLGFYGFKSSIDPRLVRLDLDESDRILSSLIGNNAPLRRLTELYLCSAMHRVVDGIAQLLDLSKMKMPSLSGTDDEDIEWVRPAKLRVAALDNVTFNDNSLRHIIEWIASAKAVHWTRCEDASNRADCLGPAIRRWFLGGTTAVRLDACFHVPMLAASLASLHAPSPCVLNLARNSFNEDDVQPLIKALAASANLTSLASSKRGRSELLAMAAACGVRMTADNLVLRLVSPGVQG